MPCRFTRSTAIPLFRSLSLGFRGLTSGVRSCRRSGRGGVVAGTAGAVGTIGLLGLTQAAKNESCPAPVHARQCRSRITQLGCS